MNSRNDEMSFLPGTASLIKEINSKFVFKNENYNLIHLFAYICRKSALKCKNLSESSCE